jgi:hypothetical protein
MLALKPVLLNGDTGVITLPYEDFVIEPKVTYTMSVCEEGHTVPSIKHNCGIMTCLDFREMESYIQPLDHVDMTRIPILGVFQILGSTVIDSDRRGFRSHGIYYYGYIPNIGVPLIKEGLFGNEYFNPCYYYHQQEYYGERYEGLREFFHSLAMHGFDYATMTGIFKGYTGQ